MPKNKPKMIDFGKSYAEFIEYDQGKFCWRIGDKAGDCHIASYHEGLLIKALIRARARRKSK